MSDAAPPPASAAPAANQETAAKDASAPGCGRTNATFYDDFTKHDPIWVGNDKDFSINAGKLAMKIAASGSRFAAITPFALDNVTICATVDFTGAAGPAHAGEGLMFWQEDNDNLYIAEVSGAGIVSVARQKAGKWSTMVSRVRAPSFKTERDAKNDFSVVLIGGDGSVLVNGVKAARFKGVPPETTWPAGPYAESQGSGAAFTATFTALAMTDMGANPTAGAPAAPQTTAPAPAAPAAAP